MNVFEYTDDVNGDTVIYAWTNGVGDLHISISPNIEGGGTNQSIYIRDGEAFAKAILKAVW